MTFPVPGVTHLEQYPRWLRDLTRAAFYSLAVCFVLSCLPVWNVWDDGTYNPAAGDRGIFWEEITNAVYGDKHRPGRYAGHNTIVIAAIGGVAFLVGFVGFRFGHKVKDGEDEPRRLRVRPWEP